MNSKEGLHLLSKYDCITDNNPNVQAYIYSILSKYDYSTCINAMARPTVHLQTKDIVQIKIINPKVGPHVQVTCIQSKKKFNVRRFSPETTSKTVRPLESLQVKQEMSAKLTEPDAKGKNHENIPNYEQEANFPTRRKQETNFI